MPLLKGESRAVISRNIAELMHAYGKRGRIGRVRPKSKGKARDIAIAIAMRKAGKSRLA